MKKCKSCQKEIDEKATKCPHCQTDLRSWFRRHPILSGILILFIIGIFAVGSGGSSKPESPSVVETEEVKGRSESDLDEIAKITVYAMRTAQISEQVGEAMTIWGEIAGKWPNWTNEDTIKFAAAGISLQNGYSLAKELTPPEIMVSVHQKMLKGLKLYAESVPIANEGIDNINPALIKKSADLIEEGTVWINEATKEVEEITENLVN